MEAVAVDVLAVDMTIAGLLVAGVLAVVSEHFYYISKSVFAFLLINIVFLIVKLVTQGQQLQIS